MNIALNYRYYGGDNNIDNIDSTTRLQRVQSVITHGITDKAAYPSKVTK